MERRFEMELAGRTLVAETGKYAQQAGGSVLMRCGDTAVLVCATCSDKPREGIDFFPLSVDFEEKLYSVCLLYTSGGGAARPGAGGTAAGGGGG